MLRLGVWPQEGHLGGYTEMQVVAWPLWDFQLRCGQKHAREAITHNAEPYEKNGNYTAQAISAKGVVTK